MEPNDIIAGLYEAAAVPERWGDALGAMASYTFSKTCHFFDWDISSSTGSWGALGWVEGAGIDPAADRLYQLYYAAIDPRLRIALRHLDAVWSCAEALPDSLIPGLAELYNDFLVPNDVRWTMGFCTRVSEGKYLILSALRGVSEGPYAKGEKRRLQSIIPHLGRVYRLQERLAHAGVKAGFALAILEHAETGYVICDVAARVTYANPAAVTLARGALRFSGGRISAEQSAVEAELIAHIETAAKPSPRNENGIGHAMRVERGDNLGDLYIFVAPLPPRATPDGLRSVPSALLIIEPRRSGAAPFGRYLVDWFGLSPAEARLALDLLAGSRLQDIAERREIRISTLRTQLSQILAKTGTTRQAELLFLLARLQGMG